MIYIILLNLGFIGYLLPGPLPFLTNKTLEKHKIFFHKLIIFFNYFSFKYVIYKIIFYLNF